MVEYTLFSICRKQKTLHIKVHKSVSLPLNTNIIPLTLDEDDVVRSKRTSDNEPKWFRT